SLATAAIASASGAAPASSAGRGGSGNVTDAVPQASSGTSTNAGPRWGVRAARNDASTSPGIRSDDGAVPAVFVIDATIGTWSSSCSDPAPQRACGARPPITSIGVPLSDADVMALMPLVTPGPAVNAATPGRRVTLAHPS